MEMISDLSSGISYSVKYITDGVIAFQTQETDVLVPVLKRFLKIESIFLTFHVFQEIRKRVAASVLLQAYQLKKEQTRNNFFVKVFRK